MEYHKGEPCIYNGKTYCQEGYCENCNLKGEGMKISGICKAKDLTQAITKAWFENTEEWEFDETDWELINSWRN